MIYIYSYDYNDNLGAIVPNSCSISIKRNEYQEATIEISIDEYKRNKNILVLLNVLQLDLKYDLEPFRIMSVDVNQKTVTITAKHYLISAKKGYCTKWEWESFCNNVTPTLVNIIDNLQLAFAGDDTTYFEFDNMTIGRGMTSTQNKIDILAWSEDGSFTSSKWTTQYTDLDFFGSTVEDIINELKDMSDINVFCYSNLFVCTFDSPSSYLKTAYSTITYNANYNTGRNADSFEYKLNSEKFYAAARGIYEVEKNDRIDTSLKYNALSGWKYNDWYRNTMGQSTGKCKRFPIFQKYTPNVKWDRRFKVKANLYYAGYNSSYPYQIYFTKEVDAGSAVVSSTNPIELSLKNVVGQELQTLEITAESSTPVIIYFEGTTTVLGHYTCVRNSTTDYKYTVKVSVVCNAFGAFVSGHEVAAEIQSELKTPQNDQKIYDVFGGDIGYFDWATYNDSKSGNSWPIYHDVDGKRSKPGHIFVTATQTWSAYKTALDADISTQVKSYIDTFNQGYLENVSADINITDENSIITPGDAIKVWCAELEVGVDLAVEGIEWDPLKRKYTNLSTGFYKKNLRQLDTSINNLQKTVRNLSK